MSELNHKDSSDVSLGECLPEQVNHINHVSVQNAEENQCDATIAKHATSSELLFSNTSNSEELVHQKLNSLTLENYVFDPTLVANDILDEAMKISTFTRNDISYVRYKDETQMPPIMHLITKDLSEPYSIYTYRYFIHNWPHLCYLAIHEAKYVGAIVCKLDIHKKITRRGYIAMLAVDKEVRRKRIGTNLVKLAIDAMQKDGCDEVVLETEVTNNSALRLYENLGFVRDKRLFRYYLNGVDALRLKLWMC